MKKLIAGVMLVLASGVGLNIGIAWAITYLQDSPAKDATVALTEAQTQDFWNEVRPRQWDDSRLLAVYRRAGFGRTTTIAKARLRSEPTEASASSRVSERHRKVWVFDFRYGWPLRSMRWFVLSGDPTIRPDGLASDVVGASGAPAILLPESAQLWPRRPIWIGFLINCALYSVLVWLLLFGRWTARRLNRLLRGHCLNCGYPVGRSPACTECGARIPARMLAAHERPRVA